jgi:hypothetical protein
VAKEFNPRSWRGKEKAPAKLEKNSQRGNYFRSVYIGSEKIAGCMRWEHCSHVKVLPLWVFFSIGGTSFSFAFKCPEMLSNDFATESERGL